MEVGQNWHKKRSKRSYLLVGHLLRDQPFYQIQPPRVGAHRHVNGRRARTVNGPALQPGASHGDRVPEPIESVLEGSHSDSELASADGAQASSCQRNSNIDIVSRDTVR